MKNGALVRLIAVHKVYRTGEMEVPAVRGVSLEINVRGITVVMVTHEQDVAAYAGRNVLMRDGVVLEDHAVSKRTNATAQLQQFSVSTV